MRYSSEYQTLGYTWPDNTVTWSLWDGVDDGDVRLERLDSPFDPDVWLRMARDAFNAWEAVCGIDFVEVSDSSDSDIRIGWAGSTGNAFFAPWLWADDTIAYGVIGITRAIVLGGVETEFNHDVLYDIFNHEVGHAVGLDHGEQPSVVNPLWSGGVGRDPLQPDDIAGAVALWGEPLSVLVANDNPAATIRGTEGADTLNGGDGNDNVYGEVGNDALLAGGGNDYIAGGAGNDRIWGQAGDDGLDGGAGADLIFGMGGNDTITGGEGGDIILSGEGDDTIAGAGGNDRIWAGDGNDTINGGEGVDFLAGGTGNDSLIGGPGADYLTGEEGDDTIDGGTGYDVLAGGAGNDSLVGGADGDTFFGQEGSDVFIVRNGVNWIMDFESVDRLNIGQIPYHVQAHAVQQDAHLRITLWDGGELYLANTTLADVIDNLIYAGSDLLV